MSKFNLTALLSGVAVVVGALSGATPAQAGELYNDWNYGIDSFMDGSGGEEFNIRGFASKETEDSLIFALTGGTPLDGVYENRAADNNIGWGDLFLNFSGESYQSALDSGSESLLGIHFAEGNDSGVTQAGVYNNVTAKNVASDNAGYSSLDYYYDEGYNKTNTYGTDLDTEYKTYEYLYGEEVANSPTRQNSQFRNVIDSGNYLGGITNLSDSDLSLEGLDFGNFNATGSHTFGFKMDKSMLADVLPSGISDYMAHIILECGNDGVALAGAMDMPEEEQDVPEPTALLGLGSLGLLLVKGRKQQNA